MKRKMRERIRASYLPLLVGMALGIVAIAVPWITANHYIWVEGTRYSVDNYLFFLWGKYYTVTGSKVIQSRMTLYSLGDFPIYGMISIIGSVIFGALAMIGGKTIVLNVKGRELKLGLRTNPIWLLIAATALSLFGYLYLSTSAIALQVALIKNNYVPVFGPSLDYLLGSVVALAIATIMTAVKYAMEERRKTIVSNVTA